MAELSRRKRVRNDIIVEILQNAIDGVRKTHIMYQVNLSHSQNERYLNAMKKAGFIAENSGVWKTTKKGLHVIEACKLCQRLTKIA